MMRTLVALLLFGGVAFSACAIPQQVDLIEKEQRRIRFDQTSLDKEITALRRDLDGARESLADTRANLEQLQREVGAVNEKVEEVRLQLDRQLGESTRAGDQRVRELESRLAKTESALRLQEVLLKTQENELRSLRETALAGQGAKPAPPATPTAVSAREAPPAEELAKKEYEEVLGLMERKEYRGAIVRFKEFLKKHPQSEYADNAQYWIGEAHYALREFDQAILEFDAVRRNYPKGDKVPAALLKLGFSFAELGDKVDARLILKELLDRYPQSEEAQKAKQKLKTLES